MAQASVVSNDGTNVCAFLSFKTADKIIHGLDDYSSKITTLVPSIKDVIWSLPGHVNAKRDMTRLYDVMEAHTILSNEKLLNSVRPLQRTSGRMKLHKKLCFLGQTDFTAVFSSVPYVAVIGCAGGRAFPVDTLGLCWWVETTQTNEEISLSLALGWNNNS